MSQQCQLPACADTECGEVNVGFSPGGGNQFCEETLITFDNTSTTTDFDYFIVDWADGDIDTVDNYNDIVHIYSIPDSALCDYPSGKILFEVCFQGIKECSEGSSCASGGYDFALLLRPKAEINAPFEGCIDEFITFRDIGCHAETYLWEFSDGSTFTEPSPSVSFSEPGTYNVKLTVTNDCGMDTDNFSIRILGNPEADASVSMDAEDGIICLGTPVTFTDQSNEWARNIRWTISPGGDSNWEFTDTLMTNTSEVIEVLLKRTQTYTIRFFVSNICGEEVWETTIEVLEGPTVNLRDGPTFCEEGIFDPQVNYTGTIEDYLWTFEGGNPSSSIDPNPTGIEYEQPGEYQVTLLVNGACGTISESTSVTVEERVEIIIQAEDQYCRGSIPDTLDVNVTGGQWSGPGITDTEAGVFDPASLSPGIYEITYALSSGACDSEGNTTIEVLESGSVNTEDYAVCESDSTLQLTADPGGGFWMGEFTSETGLFNIDSAGTGAFVVQYIYVDENGCEITGSSDVIIEQVPQLTILDSIILCTEGGEVELVNVTGAVSDIPGGDYSFVIDGDSVDNTYMVPDTTAQVPIEVTYSIGACEAVVTSILTYIEKPDLNIDPVDPAICISEGNLQITANVEGGQWSGPEINTETGEVDLGMAGGGDFTYEYVIFENSSCEVRSVVSFEIIDPSAGLVAGPDIEICEGDLEEFMLSGAIPEGGFWSGQAIIDEMNGIVDLSLLIRDSLYQYDYCLDANAVDNCQACAGRTMVVRPLPVLNYEVQEKVCVGEPFTISDSTLFGDEYLWDFGDGTSSALEQPTHVYDQPGTYTLEVEVSSPYGCVSRDVRQIIVTTAPTVQFDLLDDEGCAPFRLEIENNSFGDDISYQWFISGDTILDVNPQDIILDGIASDSLFSITLNVINSCGVVSDTQQVLVHPYPVVDIGVNVDEGCSPLAIDFGNSTIGNPDNYIWDLGNGIMSDDSIPPPQVYTTSDSLVSTYDVTLISSNACGIDSARETITVFPPDVTAFLALDSGEICQYNSIAVSSVSTPGAIVTWSVFDREFNQVDGYEGTATSFTFEDPGEYYIVLYASRCGTDTDTAVVNILPVPQLDFELPPYICLGDSLIINNLSPSVSRTNWDFGDGNFSQDFSPIHIYNSVGFFDVTLTGFSTIDNCPYTISKRIEVKGKPTAQYSASELSGCPGLEVDFINSSSGASMYVWNWGDGTSASFEEHPNHTFTEPGIYNVSLLAIDEFGCTADTSDSVIQIYKSPVSQFEFDSDLYCQLNDSIYLMNKSVDAVSYRWVVDDEIINDENPVIYSGEAGRLEISLFVESINGCPDSSSSSIDILSGPVAELFSDQTSGCQPFDVSIMNLSRHATDYEWDINGQETSSDADLNFRLDQSGSYSIDLIAKSNNGCPNDTASIEITVKEKPVAAFEYLKDSDCGVPMNVVFINNSSENIIDFNWGFGNGISSQLSNPSVVFESDDDFMVSLVVENEENCKDTIERVVPIWHQPKAMIGLNKVNYCEGEMIAISNMSENAFQFRWVIGDMDTIYSFTPDIIASGVGGIDLWLSVSYNEFCEDHVFIEDGIKVYSTPIAGFDYMVNQNKNVIGDVDFNNTSIDYDLLEWDLGDGSFSTEESFTHEYDINRGIEVTLIATNLNGNEQICRDSISKIIDPEWITTFYAPNALAPDYGSEGVRRFIPKGIGIREYEISVYSPWGKRVWHSNALIDGQPSESWNGKIDNIGKEVPQGSYSWIAVVEFINGNRGVYKGDVTVLR